MMYKLLVTNNLKLQKVDIYIDCGKLHILQVENIL